MSNIDMGGMLVHHHPLPFSHTFINRRESLGVPSPRGCFGNPDVFVNACLVDIEKHEVLPTSNALKQLIGM